MPAKDPNGINAPGAHHPASHAFAVTPHDTNELTYVTRALYIGVTSNVKVTMQGGEEVTFVGVPAGAVLPIRVVLVFATGITSTDILGLY